jgi:selenophosphate synthase
MSGEAERIPCGCIGKTPLNRVVRPAKRRVRRRLAAKDVYLAGTLDCGLLPRRESLDRNADRVTLDGDGSVRRGPTADVETPAWGLAAVLTAPEHGTSARAFADALEAGYGSLAGDGRLTIGKGHSLQISNADRTTVAFDLFRPRGERRPGFVAGNIDVIHAFPDLEPTAQAAVAGAHALNDCYAYGATEERVLRPFVGVPDSDSTADPTRSEVETWYRAGLPDDIALRRPTILRHGGDGWLFGATATAELTHVPPVHAGRLEPDDVVLLSRPLGAVAALSAARDARDGAAFDRTVETLAADHAAVGRSIASLSPGSAAEFDPDHHLKLATDVSGPGIGGVASAIARSDHRLRIERLPFVDDEAIRRARRRWLVPDATVGTNGPIAVVGRPVAIARAETRLREAGCAPVRLGCIESADGTGIVSSADGIELSQFIESRKLHRIDRDGGNVARKAGDTR